MTIRNLIIALCLLSAFGVKAADVPTMINYQGRLLENGQLVNQGGMSLTLTLYDAAIGGSDIYQEVDTVDVVDGLYSTTIGDNQFGGGASSLSTALNALGTNAWLGIQFGSDPELTPRERLQSVPYAMKAGGVTAGAVTSLYVPGGTSTGLDVEPAIYLRDTDGTGLSYPFSVAVQGNYAYVVDSTTDVLAIFEVSALVEISGGVSVTEGLDVEGAVSGSATHDVGQKNANALGAYDVSGNVWEWCWDWYGSYSAGAVMNPTGPAGPESYRVLRGGAWVFSANSLRCASRSSLNPSDSYYDGGFRCARGL